MNFTGNTILRMNTVDFLFYGSSLVNANHRFASNRDFKIHDLYFFKAEINEFESEIPSIIL